MSYNLFDYLDAKGFNQIKIWTAGLQKKEKAKFNARTDMLQKMGDELMPDPLSDTKAPGVKKLKIHGKVQLRPMLCKGPIDIDIEYTFLLGAIEKDSKLEPKDADKKAAVIKKTVQQNPTRRRAHERVS